MFRAALGLLGRLGFGPAKHLGGVVDAGHVAAGQLVGQPPGQLPRAAPEVHDLQPHA